MSKLVTSDNLKAYHGELAEHLQLLERDKAYLVGDTVKYDGLTLKCTIAGNTAVNKVDYSSIDVGDTIVDGTVTFIVIDPNNMWYEEDKFYMLDDIVVYNDKFYKCITAHTATATFDTAKWTEISAGGSGGGISTYTTGTSYSSGDLVIKDNVLYKANTTTSTTWVDSEWDVIVTTSNTASTYVQKIVTNVVAPYEMLLQVGDSNYCKPPIDVLKKTGGSANVTLTLENYNNASAYMGTSDFLKIENSKAKLYNYKEYPITTQTLSTIDIGVSDEIDFGDFYSSGGTLDSNTLVLLHFDGDTIIDECGNTIPTNLSVGLPTLDNSTYKFGSASAYFDGNHGVGIPYDSKFNFGTGDFTVDFWYKQPVSGNIPSYSTILGQNTTGVMFLCVQNNQIWLGIGNAGYQTQFSTNIRYTDGNFHHFAIVRASGVVYLFIDGELKDSGNNTSSYGFTSGYIGIGNQDLSSSHNGIIGNIDEFRISNIARWTSDFTPPTQPYGINYAYLSNNNLYTGISLTNLTNNWSGLTNAQKEALVPSFKSEVPAISDLATISPFRVLTDDTSLSNVKVTGQPKTQTITPTSLINTGAVSTVQSINITNTITDTTVKFAITTDLTTYKVYDATQGDWVTSTDVAEDGMSIAQINALTPEILALLDISNGIAFKQCFIATSENASAELSEISAVVDIDGSWSQSVHGTDYSVAYPNRTTMSVTLLTNGDYIINYPISSNS